MFRLPVCPHCKTVYRYGDIKKQMIKKEGTCYHCKKRFKIKRFPGILVLLAIIVLLCVVINILLLTKAVSLDILTMLIMFSITIIFLVAGYFLLPFFVSFRKAEKEKKEKLNWRI